MNETKMINAAKNWDIIAKVCRSLFTAGWIVILVCSALLLLFGSKMYGAAGLFTLDLDYVRLYLAEGYQPSEKAMSVFLAVTLVPAAAVCFAASCGIGQLRGILAPMKEGRPFEKDIPKKLRNIAWIILAGGFAAEITSVAGTAAFARLCPMEQLFSDAVAKTEYLFTFDLNFVLVACAVLFLSYIFAYGQKLQQESDETL